MRRLLIMRHAKSDWGGHGLADHDRPLNRRGRLAAALMGAFLREDGLRPDLALVSSALRTRETWELMALDAPTETLAVLYHAAPDAIFAAARRAPDDARTVLILGHQPGLQAAANALIGDRSIDVFPTAQIAAVDFDVDRWAEIAPGEGALTTLAAPKTLV